MQPTCEIYKKVTVLWLTMWDTHRSLNYQCTGKFTSALSRHYLFGCLRPRDYMLKLITCAEILSQNAEIETSWGPMIRAKEPRGVNSDNVKHSSTSLSQASSTCMSVMNCLRCCLYDQPRLIVYTGWLACDDLNGNDHGPARIKQVDTQHIRITFVCLVFVQLCQSNYDKFCHTLFDNQRSTPSWCFNPHCTPTTHMHGLCVWAVSGINNE